MSVGEWARMGAACGLDAVDLSILFVPDRSLDSAKRLGRQVQQTGMRVAMLTTYSDFTHPDREQRERELGAAVQSVAIAQELGADLVRVTAGQAHPETGRNEGIAWAVDGLSRLAEATRNAGVTPVYENHAKPGAWTYTDFSQPPEIFIEILEATAGTGLGLNFDTANATAFAQDPLELLNRVSGRVTSIHASDTSERGRLSPVLLGTGVTPFGEIFRFLRQANWDSWICIEEASFQGERGIAQAAAFVRQTWDEAGAEGEN